MTTTRELPPVLSIGVVFGDYDAENKAWEGAVKPLMKKVRELREGVSSPLCVNVVYHTEGKYSSIDYEGVRTGRFSMKDSLLMVQAAVPPQPTDDRRAVLLGLMRDAIDEAEAYARKRRIADNLDNLRSIVDQLPDE